MNMNRRAFFRFFGRASGTAAAVVVGGAALWPKVTGAVENPYTTPSASGYDQLDMVDMTDEIMDPLDELDEFDEFDEISWHEATPEEFRERCRLLHKNMSAISPIMS